MSERLFAQLHAWLANRTVVLASVLDTRGATPRKGGSRMLISAGGCHGSVGGGMAEARVIDAAMALLDRAARSAEVDIDLTGRPGAAGICGGRMRIGLRRWHGDADRARIAHVTRQLAQGNPMTLDADDLGADGRQQVEPDVRLLIIGAGHCGLALHDLARHLDFDQWVYDQRRDAVARFEYAQQLTGEPEQIAQALATPRVLFAVCLNRDFHCDVATLRVLSQRPPVFIGMMGSSRRIAEVLAAVPAHAAAIGHLQAPVGIGIDAQTPHEIAVSILAQLIQKRRALGR